MKASSESGECASLISTVSFSVFEAACWPGMGVSVSFSGATPQSQVLSHATLERSSRPSFGSSQRDFPVNEWVYRRRTGEKVRVAGACLAQGRAISCKGKRSTSVSNEQLAGVPGKTRVGHVEKCRQITMVLMAQKNIRLRSLQRRNHGGDGVVQGRVAVQIRLPEFLQQLEILVPTALIEAFAQRVRSVAAARGAILVAGSGAGGAKYGAKHLPRGVENQSMPEVPGNGFVALAALADDGRLHGFGDAVRTFVEQNFKGRRTLIA